MLHFAYAQRPRMHVNLLAFVLSKLHYASIRCLQTHLKNHFCSFYEQCAGVYEVVIAVPEHLRAAYWNQH